MNDRIEVKLYTRMSQNRKKSVNEMQNKAVSLVVML